MVLRDLHARCLVTLVRTIAAGLAIERAHRRPPPAGPLTRGLRANAAHSQRSGQRSQAAGLLASAPASYRELGMNQHAERASALTQKVGAAAV